MKKERIIKLTETIDNYYGQFKKGSIFRALVEYMSSPNSPSVAIEVHGHGSISYAEKGQYVEIKNDFIEKEKEKKHTPEHLLVAPVKIQKHEQ